jgi:Ca2+:H+ antiporter
MIAHEGESGRSGFHPGHFVSVLWRSSSKVSMLVNILWPFVPVAIVLHFVADAPLWTFATSYIGMVPAANLLGFAGQEFARKMPKVAGILIETTFGSIVEIILFVVLIANHNASTGSSDEGNLIPVIQAAILGSILTNLLLCLGLCFFFGGIRHASQKFHAIVSEVGNGLLLVAAFGLLIPSAFYSALKSEAVPDSVPPLGALHDKFTKGKLQTDVLRISRVASIALMFAFALYIWFCASSQHSIFDEVIEMDEHRDADRDEDLQKPKFTMTEVVIALAVSLVCVTLLLVFLVDEIEHVVKSGVPDQFLGLILLPLVEKAAEHLTAIDEARGKHLNIPHHPLLPVLVALLLTLIICSRWHDQRRPVSLSWPFHPDRSFQRPAGRHCRVGHGEAPGPQL